MSSPAAWSSLAHDPKGGLMDQARWKTWRIRGAAAAALALVLLAIGILVLPSLRVPDPRPEDWAAAAALIRPDLAPGDLIRVEPFWATGGRIWFGDLDGGPRKAFRLLDVHEPADPLWLTRAPRVWIVGAMGYGGALVEELKALDYSVALDKDLGRIRVRRLERGGTVLRWELVAHGRAAAVEGVRGGKVQRRIRRVAGGPRDCLILGDIKGSGPAVVTMRWEEIEEVGILWIRAGNTIDTARKRAQGDITVIARSDSGEASLTVPEGSYTLEALQLPFERGALEIEIRTNTDGLHQVCLDGLLVGPAKD